MAKVGRKVRPDLKDAKHEDKSFVKALKFGRTIP